MTVKLKLVEIFFVEFALVLFNAGLLVLFFEQIYNWRDELDKILYVLTTIAFIPVRVLSALLVRFVSMKQNRDYKVWTLLGFFLPSVSMMIIGSTRRIKIEGQPLFIELADNEVTKYKISKEKKYRQIIVVIIILIIILYVGFMIYRFFRY